jgi:alpha-galactosidase
VRHRLGDPEGGPLTGVRYVLGDRIAVPAFKAPWHCDRPPAPLRPEGIAAGSRRPDEEAADTHWGATPNALGLPLRWAGADWGSAILRLRRVGWRIPSVSIKRTNTLGSEPGRIG